MSRLGSVKEFADNHKMAIGFATMSLLLAGGDLFMRHVQYHDPLYDVRRVDPNANDAALSGIFVAATVFSTAANAAMGEATSRMIDCWKKRGSAGNSVTTNEAAPLLPNGASINSIDAIQGEPVPTAMNLNSMA